MDLINRHAKLTTDSVVVDYNNRSHPPENVELRLLMMTKKSVATTTRKVNRFFFGN